MNRAKVIAEIGAVHLGSMSRAKDLVMLAKNCGADYVKFQKRNPDESVPEELKNKPHPNSKFAYGDTYLEHRKALEFDINQHRYLFDYCKDINIKYSCSVWDMTSTKEIVSLNPEFIKIPSACNHNKDIVNYLINNYSGDIHVSMGMSYREEIESTIEFLSNWANRFVLYHCTSLYPCPFNKLNLLEIKNLSLLKDRGFRVGFSNHGYGIASDIAAYVLGSEFIERHFIEDRTVRHSDAAASLEPEGLRKLCRDLKNINEAMTLSSGTLDIEEINQRKKLRIEKRTND